MSDSSESPVLHAAGGAAGGASRASIWRRRWSPAVAVAGAVAVAVGATLAVSAHRLHAGLVHQLADAGLHRTFAPRLSIQTKFQPCRAQAAAPGDVPRAECPGASTDAPGAGNVTLQQRITTLAEAGDPEGIHADAVVQMVWGDRSTDGVADVVDRLRQTVRADSAPDADLLADFSAALLVHAGQRNLPLELFEALDVSEQAVERDSTNLTALYNRALAMDELTLNDEASEAWQAYLRFDSESGYAREAEGRIRALHWVLPPDFDPAHASDSALVAFAASSPQKARLMGWDVLLGEWGNAVLRGAPDAESPLHQAEVIGLALERREGGDATLAHAVRDIHAHAGDRAATRRLAQGHAWYAEARKSALAQSFGHADTLFARIRGLHAESPTLDAWTDVGRATALGPSDPEGALRLAQSVVAGADARRDPALAGMAYQTLGVLLVKKPGRPGAVAAYGRSFELLQASGEMRNASSVAINAAEAERLQHHVREAYTQQYRAALMLRDSRASVALTRTFENVSRWLAQDGFGVAAARVSDEAVAVSLRTDVPVAVVEARDLRAEGLARGGELEAALAEVRGADSLLAKLDPQARLFFTAMLDATRGVATSRSNPLEALAQLNSAIPVIQTGGVPLRLITALLARADARARLGEADSARADTQAALRLIADMAHDSSGSRVSPEQNREARRTVEHVVAELVAAGRASDALDLFESGLTTLANAPAATRPDRIPPGRVVVRYGVVGDTVLAWTLSGGGEPRVAVTRVPASELEESLRHALQVLAQRDRGEARPELSALYDWLIRPIRDLGPRETELVIVPDGALSAVPFVALFDRAGRRFLLEDHPVRLATTLAEAAAPFAGPRADGTRTAGVVLDPAFDPRLNPRLARLRNARAEAAAVAAWASSPPVVLADTAAGVARVSILLRRAPLLHFAGHAMTDAEFPDSSYLVLASGRGSDGRLSAASIAAMDLRHLDLVVLSACSTLSDARGGAGGFTGLGGAFLAAGARGVIGSLWSVDDGRTSELMHEFYLAYQTTPDPAAALRTAQLHMLRSGDAAKSSPAAWAGFEYAGR